MTEKFTAYPLKFQPIAQERLWGGDLLAPMFRLPKQDKIGEIWTLSDHPSNPSICSNGSLAGQSLTKILSSYPEYYLGEAWTKKANEEQPRFPLLVKFLHANDDLSVQIHPDDAYGLRNENDFGKTEAWYVIHAEPGAKINYGHQFINRAEYDQAVLEGKVKEYLSYVEVLKGDFIFVPSRTLHALLKGTMVIEIQQTSDVTYRVYDWDRVDDQGHSRQLHIEQAGEVMQYEERKAPTPERKVILSTPAIQHEQLVSSDYFTIEKMEFHQESTYQLSLGRAGNPDVIVMIEGEGKLLWPNVEARLSDSVRQEMSLKKGDTLLIPSNVDSYRLEGSFSILRTYY